MSGYFANIWTPFADIYGCFADKSGSFAERAEETAAASSSSDFEIQGSFADM